jgi:hypothetical protein
MTSVRNLGIIGYRSMKGISVRMGESGRALTMRAHDLRKKKDNLTFKFEMVKKF